jgi:hypothetical protein
LEVGTLSREGVSDGGMGWAKEYVSHDAWEKFHTPKTGRKINYYFIT